MGRRATVEELLAEAEANSYKRGAHAERDQVRYWEKHMKKTKLDQDITLHRYVLYAETSPFLSTWQFRAAWILTLPN